MTPLDEIWKDIPGLEGCYQVSNIGRIRSLPRRDKRNKYKGKILKPCNNGRGYFYINRCFNGMYKTIGVHRAVAMAFIPNPENKPEVNHINSIPSDNRVENLEWATPAENNRHSILYGNRNDIGSNNRFAKLTESQVIEIREITNKCYREIASQYGVSKYNIACIIKRQTWKHI